jgi:adenylylsulfate kinase-like enzyme
MIYLLFGQPCSGKTTLANYLYSELNTEKKIHIDGDEFRAVIGNFGYDRQARIENLKSAFDMALFLQHKRFIVILSFVAPYIESRYYLKDRFSNTKFIYLQYNPKRDKRGREDFHVKDFQEPTFEELINENFISLNTSKLTENQCLSKLL